jgi:hypothetical protein
MDSANTQRPVTQTRSRRFLFALDQQPQPVLRLEPFPSISRSMPTSTVRSVRSSSQSFSFGSSSVESSTSGGWQS